MKLWPVGWHYFSSRLREMCPFAKKTGVRNASSAIISPSLSSFLLHIHRIRCTFSFSPPTRRFVACSRLLASYTPSHSIYIIIICKSAVRHRLYHEWSYVSPRQFELFFWRSIITYADTFSMQYDFSISSSPLRPSCLRWPPQRQRFLSTRSSCGPG